MEVYLAIDLGSSLIKVLYGNGSQSTNPNYFSIEPEIMEIPEKYLESYRRTSNFQGRAEDYAFIQVASKYYAVGSLAKKKFRSTTDLAIIKSRYAVQRILAAVSIASQKLNAGKKIKLFLSAVLPPGELNDRQLLDRDLTTALSSFDTPMGKIQVKLAYFGCEPEGGGLSMRYQRDFPESLDQTLGVVMMGHRNLSAYSIERGVPATYKSSDLGFSTMVGEIQGSTSGYADENITHAVAQYLLSENYDSSPNPRYLHELLLRQGEVDRTQELTQLVDAIESAKKLYWLSISQWLNTQLSEVTGILIGGGTCRMFTKEFRNYTWNLPKIVGKPDRSLFNAGLVYPEGTLVPGELRDRYADIQCLWDLKLMSVVREYEGRKKHQRSK